MQSDSSKLVSDAYSAWAKHYDFDRNLTRDLDAAVTRSLLGGSHWPVVIEAGCGTGKNTGFLSRTAGMVHGFDFADGMLAQARERVASSNVAFSRVDLTRPWPCPSDSANLITFNLVLEHIECLESIIRHATDVLAPGGMLLISELHPSRRYAGGQARFLDGSGREVRVPGFLHHVSDHCSAARSCGLALSDLNEWWHGEDQPDGPPRLLTLMFRHP